MTIDFSNISGFNEFWDGTGGKKGGRKATGNQLDNINTLYQGLVGRNADPSGEDYWDKQISSGAATYQTLADSLKASNEYQDQQSEIAAGGSAQAMKSLSSAHISPFDEFSGSSFAGYDPFAYGITEDMANSLNPNVGGGAFSDQQYKTTDDAVAALLEGLETGTNPFNTGQQGGKHLAGNNNNGNNNDVTNYQQYDDSGLRDIISGLTGQLGDLRSAFDTYRTQSETDMQNMFNNANWGWGYGAGVGGVRTQNELPGWAPKKGGTSGFFGRGGRAGKGLTTSSLNI